MNPPLPGGRKHKADDAAPDHGVQAAPAHAAGSIEEKVADGIAAEERGDYAAAELLFRQVVLADPDSASARMNLGIVLHAKGDPDAAAAEHAEAVRLDPSLAHAHYNLALAHLGLDDIPLAERGFREALRLRPEFPEAWVGLADALESAGRDQEALDALESAIDQRAQYVGALFNAGLLLRRMGRLDEAERRLRGIPEDHSDYANAMTALAAILRDQGRVEEAIDAMRLVVERLPDSGVAQGELLFTQGFSDRISAEALFAEHLWAGCRAEAEVKPWRNHFANPPDPDRPLNIGYMSGDFRGHSVAVFIEFLFERHGRNAVRVHAYSSTPNHDAMTARFIAAADVWRDMRGETDAAVAKAILGDRIDILVDLSGHTSNMRIGVLAGRAAPVQMTWLGYINTTGLTRVDYRITDFQADPPEMTDKLHTERLLRMPHSQWCFRPPDAARNVAVSRDSSLSAFTFGSFNQFAKVSDATVALWIAALQAAPAARLRAVGVPRGTAAETLVHKLTRAHIDRSRFDLVERVPLADYYAEYGRVDACLDTTPYSGGTTTCDALWMGIPVITLAGSRSMSRSSASLLATVGRPDLIAQSPAEFAAIASRLATRREWPVSERTALRERMITSPLMDEQGFTQDLESLYRGAWREWCAAREDHGH